jgi:hypothetical protein
MMQRRPEVGDTLQKSYNYDHNMMMGGVNPLKLMAERELPPETREWTDAGIVLRVEGDKCEFFDEARQTHDKVNWRYIQQGKTEYEFNRLWRIKEEDDDSTPS